MLSRRRERNERVLGLRRKEKEKEDKEGEATMWRTRGTGRG